MLCLSRKRMVVTKDRPHGPGRSVPIFIVVECEDHSAIQAPEKMLDIDNKILANRGSFVKATLNFLSLKVNYIWSISSH